MSRGLADVGIAVVGVGPWGRNHVRVWQELGNLRAVCDTSQNNLDRVQVGLEVLTSTQLGEVLERADIHAVVVATPASTHVDLAVRALRAGKDVLVEKPMALTVEDAEYVRVVAREHDAVISVGHVMEYHPAVLKLRALVSEGALGDIRYLYSNRLNLGRVRIEENALWSFAPHDVALILRLMGGLPFEVTCTGGAYLNHDVADVTLMSMRFPNNVMSHVFVSWLHPYKVHRFVVVGSEQMADFDDMAPWEQKLRLFPHNVEFGEDRLPTARLAKAEPVLLDRIEPLRAECQEFLDAVVRRIQPVTDAASGIQVLRVLTAGQNSLAAGGMPREP
jgi:UDP-2-acetamido-3-amino-2,3-dideoxy-glucuronate N-acetyltransferase